MDGRPFREARERAGLSLPELAQALDVREEYLRALERGELGSLVGVSYVQSIAVRYAAAVGLDPEMVLAACDAETAAPSLSGDGRGAAQATGGRRSPRLRMSGRRVAVIVLALIVVVAATVAVLQSLSIISLSEALGGGSADRTTATAVASTTTVSSTADFTTTTSTTVRSTTSTIHSTTTPSTTNAAESFTVVFNPSADVWIEIDDETTGDVIYSGTRKAGERLKQQFTAPAKVVVGKPEVIKVSFNGRVVKTPTALVWRLSLAGIVSAP